MDKEMFLEEYRELDDRLLENRLLMEGKVIGCLWQNPDLYEDYKDLNTKSFITNDGRYYYKLGQKMAEKGYEYFDEVTVNTYIQEHSILKDKFIEKGGYDNIKRIMNIINIKNVDSYVDDIFKYNFIIGLDKEGFNIFNPVTIEENGKIKKIKPIDLFSNMDSEQVSDWYDWRIQSLSMDTCMGNTKIIDLDIDDAFLKSLDNGEEMGLPYDICCEDINGKKVKGAPILSGSTLGIHRGDVEIIGAPSGKGKSSFVLDMRVMPILYRGEKVCIMANEMNANKYKAIILPMILSHVFNYYGLNRRNIKRGNFNEEQWKYIRMAQQYYKDNIKGRLKFIELSDYGMKPAQRAIKRLSRQGVNYFIYDTFKAENMASDNTRGTLIENSKILFQLAKKYNVGVTIVMQLAIHTENTRYLTAGCLSEAKGVKEVVSELIIFRDLWEDEYSGEKYDVKPYVRMKDKETGKWLKTTQPIELDKDKKYKIFFLDKTRNDTDSKAIVFEFNGNFNSWREIGLCTPSHIDSRAK